MPEPETRVGSSRLRAPSLPKSGVDPARPQAYSPEVERHLVGLWGERLGKLPSGKELSTILRTGQVKLVFLNPDEWKNEGYPQETLALYTPDNSRISFHRKDFATLWENLRAERPKLTGVEHQRLFSALTLPLLSHELMHVKIEQDLTKRLGRSFPFERLQEVEFICDLKTGAIQFELNRKDFGIGPTFYETSFALASRRADLLVNSTLGPLYASQYSFSAVEAIENIEKIAEIKNPEKIPVRSSAEQIINEFSTALRPLAELERAEAAKLDSQSSTLKSLERQKYLLSWTPESFFAAKKRSVYEQIAALQNEQSVSTPMLTRIRILKSRLENGIALLGDPKVREAFAAYSAEHRDAFRRSFDQFSPNSVIQE